jgi:hypothetical protein
MASFIFVIFGSRLPASPFVNFFLFAIVVSSNSIAQGVRIWLLFRFGRWKRFDGKLGRRTKHPARFWIVAASHTLVILVWVAGVTFLFWTAASPRLLSLEAV